MTERRAGNRPRKAFAPRASFEELEIHTRDGVALRAIVEDPPAGVAVRGTCVMAHALFARKSEFGGPRRAGLAQTYAAQGWRTIAFDFRGHGDSGSASTEEWGYDDLVRSDLPAVVASARARNEGKPVVVVGHSLGGHVALASQGTGRLQADAIIAIGAGVFLRAFSPSPLRAAGRRLATRALLAAAVRAGGVPARRLRMGSDDASARFMADLLAFIDNDAWRSTDQEDDYLEGLARVVVPVCAIASDSDHVMCPPYLAEAFARRCKGPVELVRLTASDDGGRAPGHMEMVTTRRVERRLREALAWVERQLDRGRSTRP
jgi:predicted alpha/beta hydrolase